MQDEPDNCSNSSVEETSTDVSSAYESSVHDEEEEDAREEAILSETDRVNLAYPREFGYTKIYEVEQGVNGNAGTKMAIPKVSLYLERGKALQELNMIEYACLIQTEKKKAEKDNDADDCVMDDQEGPDDLSQRNSRTRKRGRESSQRFEYSTECELQRLFQQQLATKQSLPFVIGAAPPKRLGNKPLYLNENESTQDYEKRLYSWQKHADAFAKYYLLLFRPTSKNFRPNDFTFEALQNWIATCSASKNWLQKSRLAMFNDRLNGMSISSINKKIITAYRGRYRTIWTEQERQYDQEHFASQHAQQAEDLEASGLTPAEYNLEHCTLSNKVNKQMKKQESDLLAMETALKNLFRITPDATANNVVPSHPRVGQQAAKRLVLTFDSSILEKIYSESEDTLELNIDVASLRNGGFNGVAQTEAGQSEMDPINSKTYELELDQRVVFKEVVRLILQGNDRTETRPILVLGPAGTGKTHLIFAILDAAESKAKQFICTSFNAITATAIGGDTFSGDFLWNPKLHQQRASPFSPKELIQFVHRHGFDNANDLKNTVVGIIIDEISTFSPEMICLLDTRLRQVTGTDKPFGGLIVLMVGDFGQLAPVDASAIPNAVVNCSDFLFNPNKTAFLRREMLRQNQIRKKKEKRKNQPGKACRTKFAMASLTKDFTHRCSEGHPYKKGIDLLTSARLFDLTTQKRAQDPMHRKHVEMMFRGDPLTFQMFEEYRTLQPVDIMQEGSDFCDAPILCSTNRERHTLNGIMAPIKAAAKGVCAIRWRADLQPFWDQKPADEYISQVIDSDPVFWEYFVPETESYITENLRKRLRLINGTKLKCSTLSFDTHEKQIQFEKLVANTRVGGLLSLPLDLRPETQNVELVNLSKKTQQQWLEHGLSLHSNKVVIPIPCRRNFFSKTPKPILVPGGRNGKYKCSKIRIRNFFPIEPGFAITINKAQGKTIPKVILAVSERHGDGCGLSYRSVYVAFSRVKDRNDIRLLLFHDKGTRESLTYLTKLTADPCNLAFIEGFDRNGGEFNYEKVFKKHMQLTGNPKSPFLRSSNKRKRN